MASVTGSANQMLGILLQRLPTVGPVLLLSVGYIDPGKWAAAVEGGARFGFDLSVLMLIFNFAAILCQYLTARIGVVTGKNLAQIYSEEYNKSTCILLGIQAEVSVIASDLTMVLGIAHGLNLLFGMDLLTCVFFAAFDAVLFPLFATLWQKHSQVVPMSIMALLLLSYVLGVVISQPEISVAMNGVLTRLSGESVFLLMSLLGATIVPHNFYVHSSIVQQLQVQPHASKDAMCHDHFVAILCIFSGIFVMNYVLMNSAATVFHSAGVVVLTFQDALLLMDQVFRSPVAPFVFFLVLFLSSQVTALTWNLGGQVVLRYLFRIDPPDWLHRAVIRILAIVPALYCAWNYGAEGIYQMLIFAQVMLAMLLPSSIIPLFRVASSRLIMGVFKVSQSVEFLTLITLIGMLGLKIMFVVEMLFGSSDWVGNLKSNMGSSAALPHVLIFACLSLCIMLWLVATPLKSATVGLDSQLCYSDLQKTQLQQSLEREENDLIKARYQEEPAEEDLALEKTLGCPSDGSVVESDIDLPETIMDSDQEPHLISIETHTAHTAITTSTAAPSTSTAVRGSIPSCPEESASTTESVPDAVVGSEACDDRVQNSGTSRKSEYVDPVEKVAGVVGDLQNEKDDDDGDTWEPEESSKVVSGSGPSSTSEGPGSFRTLSGKSDEGGNGGASLSRLSGLGRAARRQLAAIMDEFWGQLYDFHGQATQEAKAKKLDMVLLGADPRATASSPKLDTSGNESSGYFSDRGSGFPVNSSLYDSSKQQRVPKSVASSYGAQMGSSSSWSTHLQLLDAYVHGSSNNVHDYGERRYSSLHLPPSSEGWDYQPATVHGYQIASYLSRMASERDSDSLTSLMDPPTPKSTSFVPTNYRDSIAYSLGQNPQNGFSSMNASSIRNPAVGRNISLQTERPYYDPCSSDGMENSETSAYNKKYHSLPDISGLAIPGRDSLSSERSAQWGSPIGFGQVAGRTTYEQSPYSSSGPRAGGVPLPFDEISPSKLYRDPFSVQRSSNSDTRSLWSRQPFEQLFGVAERTQCVGDDGVGSRSNSVLPEASSHIDLEAKLLQSFRYCIVKLLKLEGSDWLFRQNDGADEDLIHLVAARERFHYEAETREVNRVVQMGASRYPSSDRKFNSALKNEEAGLARLLVSSVPHCGEGCVWRVDLIVSFGVWCIHRIFDLSLMESRPELWGKYTYVLNRLQGILDLAFSKPRSPLSPCFCLQVPVLHLRKSSPPPSNGVLLQSGNPVKVKYTSASMLLDIIKDVELAVSCRKGRTGTAAGDVAFPKGKENLASVLKRYKRRLSNKPVGTHEGGSGLRKVSHSHLLHLVE